MLLPSGVRAALPTFLLLAAVSSAAARYSSGDEFGMNCTVRSSCGLSPDNTSYHMNCGCDATCAVYADCCEDADASSQLFPNSIDDNLRMRMTCVNDPRLDRRFPVYVLKKCVDNFPDAAIRSKCELLVDAEPKYLADIFPYIPVTSLQTGILYRNSYCALCNNEKDFEVWRVNISANDNELLKTIRESIATSNWTVISNLKHMVEYSHPLYKPHMCKAPRTVCAAGWPDDHVSQACYREPTDFRYRIYDVYKNIHCAMCNNIDKADSMLGCLDGRALIHTSNPVFRDPPSFSILFDFMTTRITLEERQAGGRWVTTEETIDVLHCDEGQVFDPFKASCQQLYCQPGYVMQETQCVSAEDGGTTCPMVSFKKGEFEYLVNKSVYIYALQAAYPPAGEYWTDGAHILICNPEWGDIGYNVTINITEWEIFFKTDPIQGYFTLALSVISIIGLCIQLGVYAYFPVLRNTPGKCLMCLSGSLLVAQLLFSIGVNENEIMPLCKTIAVLLHYGFLAYFFWMNTMAFDIFRAFNGKNSYTLSRSAPSRRFLHYSLYAWLSPLVIVLVALILDLTHVQEVMPAYGAAFCWFGNQNGLVVFFMVPIAALLLVDIIFFVLTVREIHQVKESTKGIQKSTGEQQRFGLYVKLAVVMGLTWILGFVALLIHSTIVWYFFVVLNCLQGLWICLTFICNAKVINMIRGRYKKYRLSTISSYADRTSKTRSTIVSERASRHPKVERGHEAMQAEETLLPKAKGEKQTAQTRFPSETAI